MNLIRTTLPLNGESGNRSEILKRWRAEYARRFEILFEVNGYITRVASDSEETAWGECIAASLQSAIADLPENWLYLIEHDGNFRCVIWADSYVRHDELVESSLLAEWLSLHNDFDAAYSEKALPFEIKNHTVIAPLELNADAFALVEFKGSPLADLAKKMAVIVSVAGLATWMMWPEPPPPPSPESLDPWLTYRTSWTNTQLAGDVFEKLGAMCAKLSTVPGGVDINNGTISKGSIGAVLPELGLKREVLNSWASKHNLSLALNGPQPFLSMPVPESSTWSTQRTNFGALDDKLADMFSRLAQVTNLTASTDTIEDLGLWKRRRMNLSITANPWVMKEIGASLQGMPIMLETASFTLSKGGECAISNAVIQFEGSAAQ